jgi:hypothetical protein
MSNIIAALAIGSAAVVVSSALRRTADAASAVRSAAEMAANYWHAARRGGPALLGFLSDNAQKVSTEAFWAWTEACEAEEGLQAGLRYGGSDPSVWAEWAIACLAEAEAWEAKAALWKAKVKEAEQAFQEACDWPRPS